MKHRTIKIHNHPILETALRKAIIQPFDEHLEDAHRILIVDEDDGLIERFDFKQLLGIYVDKCDQFIVEIRGEDNLVKVITALDLVFLSNIRAWVKRPGYTIEQVDTPPDYILSLPRVTKEPQPPAPGNYETDPDKAPDWFKALNFSQLVKVINHFFKGSEWENWGIEGFVEKVWKQIDEQCGELVDDYRDAQRVEWVKGFIYAREMEARKTGREPEQHELSEIRELAGEHSIAYYLKELVLHVAALK